MIRTTFVLALALMAGNAMATPKVGDEASFALTITDNGQSTTGTLTMQLTQFNTTNSQYLEHQVIQVQGNADQTQDNWTNASDLLSDAQIQEALANCTQSGGTSLTLQVPAGTFPSCAIPFSNSDGSKGTVWVANVPLGAARIDSTDTNGVTVSAQLSSFQAGN